jgi:16S rRNA (uracil1498-N3)-methyltransferase
MIRAGGAAGECSVRINRLYTAIHLEPGAEVVLEGPAAHYLGRVLRVGPGQSVVLFNGDGQDYAADVLRPGKGSVVLEVRSRLPAVREPDFKITVAQAISRGERMDQTLQKCTELGASAFRPLFSERVEVRLTGGKLERRMAHWQGVVVAACEQSGRAVVPQVLPALDLDDWLAGDRAEQRIVMHPGADAPLARLEPGQRVELAVGPEGGFSDVEYERILAGGVRGVQLGRRILRTETAAPAAVAILQALYGDLGA